MRSRGFAFWGALALMAAVLLPPGSASAQWRYMFPSGFTLTEEDMRIQREAILRLVRAEPPAIGGSEQWQNPRSRARGTITLLAVSEVRRRPCRKLRFEVTTPRVSDPVDMTFTLCRDTDGAWKIG